MRPLRTFLGAGTIVVTALVALPAPAQAGPALHVTTTSDVVNAGDGQTSLREAISAADADGVDSTITLDPATYDLDLCADDDTNAGGDLDTTAAGGLTIVGRGAKIRQQCTGERVFQALDVDSATVLRHVKITGGNGQTTGAAIVTEGDLTLIDADVSGNDGGMGTVIDGDSSSGSVFDIRHTTIGPNTGRGIRLQFGTVKVTRSVVRDQTLEGIGLIDGHLELKRSRIVRNGTGGARTTGQGEGTMLVARTKVQDNGGPGLTCSACGNLTVIGSKITGNHPTGTNRGGGVLVYLDQDSSTDLEVTTIGTSTIANNTAHGDGGGLAVLVIESDETAPAAQTVVRRSTISGNLSNASGGGVYVGLGEAHIVNSTVSGNKAATSGGGLVVTQYAAELLSATFADNTAPSAEELDLAAGLVSHGSVIATPGSPADCAITGGTTSSYSASSDNSCGLTGSHDQPGLGGVGLQALADNGGPTRTRKPTAGSPLRSAIPAGDCPTSVDQRDHHRPVGPRCEIGALERT